MDDLKAYIREVPDFPKPGILFYDITTLLQDPLALRMTVDRFVWLFARKHIQKVVGIESRGFIFAGAVAHPAADDALPVGAVDGDLPDRVAPRRRAPARLLGGEAAQRAEQVRPVPGLAVEALVEQGEQEADLGVGAGVACHAANPT